jgi:hypothetical protein
MHLIEEYGARKWNLIAKQIQKILLGPQYGIKLPMRTGK